MATATRVRQRSRQHGRSHDPRVQHELKELQRTDDLRDIDDDVEDIATLYRWSAAEHAHFPKSPRWFISLAVMTTALVGVFLVMFNFIAAITTAVVGVLLYRLAQKQPETVQYRIMTDGVAIGTTLYHYRDLDVFNVLYEPQLGIRVVLLKSKRWFSPLHHMEIGEADPVAIRDVLLEFIEEDQDLEEPLVDVIARRVGF